jgi:hypothetical protein
LAPDEPAAERDSLDDVALMERLKEVLWRLNPVGRFWQLVGR